jgi:hypothetical protein
MKSLQFSCLSVALSLLVTGCHPTYDQAQLGPSRPTVQASVNSMGGLEAWNGVQEVRATALITTYDQGQPTIDRATLRLTLLPRKLQAAAPAGEGLWRATISQDGKCDFRTVGYTATPQERQRICQALAVLLNRMPGALNLVQTPQRVTGVTYLTVLDQKLVRVAVKDRTSDTKAYYFEQASKVLRFVTAGADKPGGEGTVTLYEYQRLPGGLSFPKSLRVVHLGTDVLIGDKPVLDAEFTNLKLTR